MADSMLPQKSAQNPDSLYEQIRYKIYHQWLDDTPLYSLPECERLTIAKYGLESTSLTVEKKLILLWKSIEPSESLSEKECLSYRYLKHRFVFLTHIKKELIKKAQQRSLSSEDKKLLNQVTLYSHSCFGLEETQPLCRIRTEPLTTSHRLVGMYHPYIDMP